MKEDQHCQYKKNVLPFYCKKNQLNLNYKIYYYIALIFIVLIRKKEELKYLKKMKTYVINIKILNNKFSFRGAVFTLEGNDYNDESRSDESKKIFDEVPR